MSKHTPGPWTFERATYSGENWSLAGSGNYVLTTDHLHADQLGDEEADFRLMTAAPDFLAACQGPDPDVSALDWLSALLTDLEDDPGSYIQESEDPEALETAIRESRRLLEGLRAAVRKAEGEG